jgi:hypothetical protein
VFYIFIGIYFCERLLRLYGAKTLQSFFICLLLVFGTNLFFYGVVEPSMSHAYSFATIAAFLFYVKKIIDSGCKKCILAAFISLGLIILTRPVNIMIILALPFLAGSFSRLKEFFLFIVKNYLYTGAGILLGGLIVGLQLFVWHKQTGHFFVYSYNDERFYFNNPNVLNILFSYRKGLFIYTPLFFLALTGFKFLFRKNKFSAISLILFFIFVFYIMSCWHLWFYGSSFGFRPMIDYYSLLALLLLFSLNVFNNKPRRIVFVFLCMFALFVNQVQAYQYRKFILHWYNMSSNKYWKIFLKTDERWSGYVWNYPESSELGDHPIAEYKNDFEEPNKDWNGNGLMDVGEKAHSGKRVSVLDEKNIYSNTLILPNAGNMLSDATPAILVTGSVFVNQPAASDKLQLVTSCETKEGGKVYYRSRFVDELYPDLHGWKRFEITMKLEKTSSPSDIVKIYFWNPDKHSFWLDDVSIKIFNQK